MGQASLSSYFMTRPPLLCSMLPRYAKLGDLGVLSTCVNRPNCVVQKSSKRVDLGFGPGELQFQCLHFLMQHFKSHHQNFQRFSEKYCFVSKSKVSDLNITNRCSAMTLISLLIILPIIWYV